jgi:hypothetical protein
MPQTLCFSVLFRAFLTYVWKTTPTNLILNCLNLAARARTMPYAYGLGGLLYVVLHAENDLKIPTAIAVLVFSQVAAA